MPGAPGGGNGTQDGRLSNVDESTSLDARQFSFSASESNPEEIEPQETRMNTGFSTFGRIGGRPKETEKERPGGPFWAAKRGEKGVSRPKVCDGEKGANDAISSQNPPLGEAGFERQRMFR